MRNAEWVCCGLCQQQHLTALQIHSLAEQDARQTSARKKGAKPKKSNESDNDISAGDMSLDEGGSDGSFDQNLNKVLTEGAADAAKGKEVFGGKKRAIDDANEPSEKGGNLVCVNKNHPILILQELPEPTRLALTALPAATMERQLLDCLDAHTNRLNSALSKALVHEEKTMWDKFEKLEQMMKAQGLVFAPQTDFK